MIALAVHVNGKRLCLAGADDLCVLHAILTVGGALGSRTARPPDQQVIPTLHIGGMTAREEALEGQHLRWAKGASFALGDKLEIQLVDVPPETADPPVFEASPEAEAERRRFLAAKAQYLGLRSKYESPG